MHKFEINFEMLCRTCGMRLKENSLFFFVMMVCISAGMLNKIICTFPSSNLLAVLGSNR